jgi:hypothetical protein
VKAITGDVHVFNDRGGIEGDQLHSQFLGVGRLNTPGCAGVKELLQPFVFERLITGASVACCATLSRPG